MRVGDTRFLWVLVALWLAALLLHFLVPAEGYPGTPPGSVEECAPSYLVMDPDSGGMLLIVSVQVDGATWVQRYGFPSDARCQETRAALVTVLERAGVLPGLATVGVCH